MILNYDLDFQPVYTMTKEDNLRTISSVNCINCLAFPSLAPAPTTHKGMGKLREWTTRYCLCYEHFHADLKKRKWDESHNKMIHASNCTKHEATGPCRVICCLDKHHTYLSTWCSICRNQDCAKGDYNTHVQNGQHDMKKAYQIAQQNAKKTAERGSITLKESQVELSSQAIGC